MKMHVPLVVLPATETEKLASLITYAQQNLARLGDDGAAEIARQQLNEAVTLVHHLRQRAQPLTVSLDVTTTIEGELS